MFISKCKTIRLPYTREINRLLAFYNVNLRNEIRVEMSEFENLIDTSILRKMSV